MQTLILILLFSAPLHPACEGERSEIFQGERRPVSVSKARRLACSSLAVEAEIRGLDPHLAVELAWTESRWDPAAFNEESGCLGILQYDPRFWADGLEALAFYLAKHPREPWRAVCDFKIRGTPHCAAGAEDCCPRSKWVVRRARAERKGRRG